MKILIFSIISTLVVAQGCNRADTSDTRASGNSADLVGFSNRLAEVSPESVDNVYDRTDCHKKSKKEVLRVLVDERQKQIIACITKVTTDSVQFAFYRRAYHDSNEKNFFKLLSGEVKIPVSLSAPIQLSAKKDIVWISNGQTGNYGPGPEDAFKISILPGQTSNGQHDAMPWLISSPDQSNDMEVTLLAHGGFRLEFDSATKTFGSASRSESEGKAKWSVFGKDLRHEGRYMAVMLLVELQKLSSESRSPE